MIFEKHVLQEIKDKVKIGIKDMKHQNCQSDEVKKWLKKYNVQYYESYNSSCLHHFSKTRNLKVIKLWRFPSCGYNEMNVFLQLKNLHSLTIIFKTGVKYSFSFLMF